MFTNRTEENLSLSQSKSPEQRAERIREKLIEAFNGFGVQESERLHTHTMNFINRLCDRISDSSSGQAIFKEVKALLAETQDSMMPMTQNFDSNRAEIRKSMKQVGGSLHEHADFFLSLPEGRLLGSNVSEEHTRAFREKEAELRKTKSLLSMKMSLEAEDDAGITRLMRDFTNAFRAFLDAVPSNHPALAHAKTQVETTVLPNWEMLLNLFDQYFEKEVYVSNMLDRGLMFGIRRDHPLELAPVQVVFNSILPSALSPSVWRDYEKCKLEGWTPEARRAQWKDIDWVREQLEELVAQAGYRVSRFDFSHRDRRVPIFHLPQTKPNGAIGVGLVKSNREMSISLLTPFGQLDCCSLELVGLDPDELQQRLVERLNLQLIEQPSVAPFCFGEATVFAVTKNRQGNALPLNLEPRDKIDEIDKRVLRPVWRAAAGPAETLRSVAVGAYHTLRNR